MSEDSLEERVEKTVAPAGTDAAEPPSRSRYAHYTQIPYRGIITVSVMLAAVMQALDTTIANVALPHMQGTLSATQDQMGWVLTSYIVAVAITIPLSGWLAGELGRRRVFLTSIALFVITSALCGMATSLPEIVIFRFLQGVGGAALMPLSQATLFDINSPRNFGRAMSIWGIGVTLGPALGPALGGWLTQYYSWRWVFFINLPIGILCFTGLLLTMPESRNEKSSRFDFFGFSVLSITLGSLQLLLDRGQLLDWFSSTEIMIYAVAAGLGFYLFIIHMFSHPRPFLNPELFRDRNFLASTVFIFVLGVVLFATLALQPPMLQNLMDYPVVLTGMITAPRGFGTFLSMFIVGRLVNRFDPRYIMAVGLVMSTYALWQMLHFSLTMDSSLVIWSGLLQGMGVGLVYVPLSAVAFTTLHGHLRNEGTAFFNLLRNMGSSIGISVVFFLLTQNTQRLHSALGQNITPYNVTNNPALASLHIDPGTTSGLLALNHLVTDQGQMIAYLDDYKIMMVLSLLTLPFLLLIRRPHAAHDDQPVVIE